MSLSQNDNDCLDFDDEVKSSITNSRLIRVVIPDNFKGTRLDAALAAIIPEISRSKLTNWIKDGLVLVNKAHAKPKDKVVGNEEIEIIAPIEEQTAAIPEDIPLNIVFEDDYIVVINKPSDFVVHPGNGNWHGTILNAILFHYPNNQYLARGGIVHRLDKDTTGLMVIAKTELAQINLIKQLEERSVSRIYRAIVHGHPNLNGIINKNIGRDNHNRIKMSVIQHGGKLSITNYRVIKYFDEFSYIECKLETGRTHQIRVHLKSIDHPIIGDPLYGSRKTNFTEPIKDALNSLNRQALHALKLSFIHPVLNKKMEFRTKIPSDMQYVLSILNNDFTDDFDDYDNSDNAMENANWEIIYAK